MTDVDDIREGFAAFARGDLDAITAKMSPDIVWHVPGHGTLAGDKRGIDAVVGYFGQLFERSGGTFKAELQECGEIAPGLVTAVCRISGDMDGGRLDQRCVQLYRREGGRTVECSTFVEDDYAADASDGMTPEALTRRGYDAFARGDMDTLREILSPDVVWHEPGRSAIAGTYRGIDAVLGFFLKTFEISGGTFKAELLGCAEIAPGLVAALARDTATMPGGAVDATNVHVFRVEDGRAVEVTGHPGDVYAFDAAMGTAITLPDARREQAPVTT